MEGENMETPPSGGSSPANHRWNPTKEQITMLENLYKQGVRTPSAEQIQEITTRLQVYGHIEGKNVFYWFQNHKARQRQKQKQHHHNSNMANFFTRRVHHHQPAVSPFHSPPPLSPNIICSPYFLPQSEIAFYSQCPKLLLPTNRKRAPWADKVDKTNPNDVDGGLSGQLGLHATLPPTTGSSNIVVQETLPLFPLHPTGVLQKKTGRSLSLGPNSSETSVVNTPSTSLDTIAPSFISSFNEHVDAGAASHLFFDFLSEKGST